MPFIDTKTTVKIDKETELRLKAEFAKAIELIPGKSERWLMLSFSDNERMWFVGDDAPLAALGWHKPRLKLIALLIGKR